MPTGQPTSNPTNRPSYAPSFPPIVDCPVAGLFVTASAISCAHVSIDPTKSVSPPGTALKWRVFRESTLDPSLSAYLNSNYNSSTASFAVVPGSVLGRGNYKVELTLSSPSGCLESSVNSSFAVVQETTYLQVNIVERSPLTLFSNQSLNVRMTTALVSCGGLVTDVPDVRISWSIYEESRLLNLKSVSLDPRVFYLPAYALNVSQSYNLTAFASYSTQEGSIYNGSASILVQVVPAGVIAEISGGSHRVISIRNNIVLDGSNSIDVDHPTCRTCLTYKWGCVEGQFSLPCNLNLSQSAVLMLSNGSLAVGANYTFSLTVSNQNGSRATTNVSIVLVEDPLPVIDLIGFPTKINAGSNLVLQARVQCAFSTQATWTSPHVDVMHINRTVSQRFFSPLTSTLFQLGLDTSLLLPGETYAFTISAAYYELSPLASTATLSLVINRPPFGGAFEVRPREGIALNTTINMLASSWTDDAADLPLQYAFGYFTPELNPITLRRSSVVNYLSSILGQGPEGNGFNMTLFAYIYDIYSGQTVVESSIIMVPQPVSVILSSSALLLSQAKAFQDAGAVTQVISGVAAAINAQNCSVPIDCSSLNRKICFSTPNTCGSCIDGFIGALGDANLPCAALVNAKGNGEYCVNNNQCISGNCSQNRCGTVFKTCPSNCSAQGECNFYDLNHDLIPSCAFSDSTCFAKCDCNQGYFGSHCSLQYSLFNASQGLRESLCSNLYWAMSMEDADNDVVFTRAQLIASILLDTSQITASSMIDCSAALIDTIQANPNLITDSNTAISIISAISGILQFGSSLPNDTIIAINNALQTVSSSLQQLQLLPGEAPVDILTRNLRFRSAILSAENMNSTDLSLPLSSAEELLNLTSNRVRIHLPAGQRSDAGITLVQFTNNLANSTLLSPEIQIQISGTNTVSRRRLTESAQYSATVTSSVDINYSNLSAPLSGTVHCDYRPSSYDLAAECQNQSFVIPCPARSILNYNYDCPGQQLAPACLVRVGSEAHQNPSCEVLTFNATTIVCHCDIASADSLTLGQVISLDLAASLIIIGTSFVARIESSASLSSTNFSDHILVVSSTSVFLAGILIGLVVFINLDARELQKYVALSKATRSSSRKLDRNIHSIFDTVLPVEFSELPWYVRWWRKVLEEHDWMCLFVPYADGGKR